MTADNWVIGTIAACAACDDLEDEFDPQTVPGCLCVRKPPLDTFSQNT